MRITTPRYKVTFDGWLYTEEKDICTDCFKRIADEIKQADIPQTETHDLRTDTHECVSDTPQTDCAWHDDKAMCNRCGETDCAWK